MLNALTNPKFVLALGLAVSAIVLAAKTPVEKAHDAFNHLIDACQNLPVVSDNND